ncbi:MAG: hypothetical protein CMM47_01775 [Rhodospirillaceae bacterium]|nr:hypothetical protein [Rhodospirillaceae bacterium]
MLNEFNMINNLIKKRFFIHIFVLDNTNVDADIQPWIFYQIYLKHFGKCLRQPGENLLMSADWHAKRVCATVVGVD